MSNGKQVDLDALKKKMASLPLPLKRTARNMVFGAGSCDPKVFFIGEAPGAKEDEQGLPFVGMAGKQLNVLLHSIGLSREAVYITSIIKYRPPKNRQPTLFEIKKHTPFLVDQIRIIQPPLLVPLGNFATRFILSGMDITKMSQVPGITQVHGKIKKIQFEGMALMIFPVFHPAAILYKRSLQKVLEKDFRKILQYLH